MSGNIEYLPLVKHPNYSAIGERKLFFIVKYHIALADPIGQKHF